MTPLVFPSPKQIRDSTPITKTWIRITDFWKLYPHHQTCTSITFLNIHHQNVDHHHQNVNAHHHSEYTSPNVHHHHQTSIAITKANKNVDMHHQMYSHHQTWNYITKRGSPSLNLTIRETLSTKLLKNGDSQGFFANLEIDCT